MKHVEEFYTYTFYIKNSSKSDKIYLCVHISEEGRKTLYVLLLEDLCMHVCARMRAT